LLESLLKEKKKIKLKASELGYFWPDASILKYSSKACFEHNNYMNYCDIFAFCNCINIMCEEYTWEAVHSALDSVFKGEAHN
jgi:hypothetical protein